MVWKGRQKAASTDASDETLRKSDVDTRICPSCGSQNYKPSHICARCGAEPALSDASAQQGAALLEQLGNHAITDTVFLRSFADKTVHYSTPFGDHKDGGPRVFLLQDSNKNVFLPAFLTAERAREFFEEWGRVGFVLLSNSFQSLLQMQNEFNKSHPKTQMGVMLDPAHYVFSIKAADLEEVIRQIK